MTTAPARWLTLDEVCHELRFTERIVRRMINKGKLVVLRPGESGSTSEWRILDPSEKYKQALQVQESLMRHQNTIDLLEFPCISTREFAEIAGISQGLVRKSIESGKIKPYKLTGYYSLFTVREIRGFLMAREKKEVYSRRVRCAELVRWCRRALAENPLRTLTSEQVKEDDALEGALRAIMRQREPERGKHLHEFWRRFELANGVAKSMQKHESETK